MSTIGARLRQAREARGMSLQDLSKNNAILKNAGHLQEFEDGLMTFYDRDIIALCRALDISADWLLGLSEQGGPE